MKKYIALRAVSVEKLKILNYHMFLIKTLVLSITCGICGSNDEKIFKEEEPIEI